jgi:hypothetical protein
MEASGVYSLSLCDVPNEVPVDAAGRFRVYLKIIDGLHDDRS